MDASSDNLHRRSSIARAPAALRASRPSGTERDRRLAELACCSARAERLSVMIDACEYFAALDDVLRRARSTVRIMGWDLDARVKLRPSTSDQTFGELIIERLRSVPTLEIHCLIWGLIGVQAEKRELPPFNSRWTAHPRFHFRYDMDRPIESSRHEKLIVVDDALAFIGCTDVSRERWDVRGHDRSVAHLRVNGDGEPYRPHHDLQAVLDGDAARRLGEHFTEAWHRASGERLATPVSSAADEAPWPRGIEVGFRRSLLHLSRTAPPFDARPAIEEVRATAETIIAAADRLLYIEMQYLTSLAITDALCARLSRADAPHVLLVLPEHANTLIERRVMQPLQNERLCRLLDHDRHGRLRVTHPVLAPGGGDLMLHSKLTIADDEVLLLGSANFNDRSMSVDNEIDFTLCAASRADREAIARLRHDLLAEHLGVDVAEVASFADDPARLFERLDAQCDRRPGLSRYRIEHDPMASRPLIDAALADPASLYGALQMNTLDVDAGSIRKRLWAGLGSMALACVALALLWTLTPAEQWFREWLLEQGAERSALSIAGVVLALTAASLVMMPITLITVVCFVLLGPWLGMATALSVSLGSAALGYGLGAWLNDRWLDRLGGSRLDALKRKLAGAAHGVPLVVAIRFMPVAPFTAVNLAIGASEIRFLHFMVGSLIGLLPGKLLIAVFADRALRLMEDPSWQSVLIAVLVAAVTIALAWLGARWLERRSAE